MKKSLRKSEMRAKSKTFIPPVSVARNAARALRWHKELGSGMTAVGVRRAVQLSKRQPVSLQTLKRMKAYFDRHESDSRKLGFRVGWPGYSTKGRIAWDAWGGKEGRDWAEREIRKAEKK